MYQDINISRFSSPAPRGVLPRPRLIDLLSSHINRRVIKITGPGGSGKTTLISSLAEELNVPLIWVQLVKEDADPVNLYYSLVCSLRYRFQATDFTHQVEYPSVGAGMRELDSLYREWAQILFRNITPPLVVVLDEFEQLGNAENCLKFIEMLCSEAPLGISFILSSRDEILLKLQRQTIRQYVYTLPSEELDFTEEEIGRFFKEICQVSLSQKSISHMHRSTEGWVGGTIILWELIKSHPLSDLESFIEKRLPGAFRRELFKFFGEEIFNTHPPETQQVLMKLALFDYITWDYAADFLEGNREREILKEVAGVNLFVKRISYSGGNALLFHKIFRDFLLEKLQHHYSPEARRQLYLKAARLYQEKGDYEAAIKLYISCEEHAATVWVLEKIGVNLLQRYRLADLGEWLASLPQSRIENNPWMLFFFCSTVRFSQPRDNQERLSKALYLFEQENEMRGCLLALGALIDASFFAGEDTMPMVVLIEKGEQLIKAAESEKYNGEKAILLLQMGLVYSLREWTPQKGCWASQNAYLLLASLGIQPLQVNALSNLFLSYQMSGNFKEAVNVLAKLDKVLKKLGVPEYEVFHTINLGQFLTLKGDFKLAATHLQRAKQRSEELGLLYLYLPILLQELFLYPRMGKFIEAERTAEQVLAISGNIGNLFFKGLALLFLGASFYHKKEYTVALEYVESSTEIFSSAQCTSRTHLATALLVKGILKTHLGAFSEAQTHLYEEWQPIDEEELDTWAAHGHFARALLCKCIDQSDRAVAHLKKGVDILERQKCTNLHWVNHQDMADVCTLAVEHEMGESSRFCHDVLLSGADGGAMPKLDRLMDHPDKPVRARALALRRKVYQNGLPRMYLRSFGGLQVLLNDRPMGKERWQRKSSQTLLKAMLARGGQEVHKELIIDDLWPDAPPSTGEKRFKVELHRLRKSLEPELRQEFGSTYILLSGNHLSFNESFCDLDIASFTSHCSCGNADVKAGRLRDAESHFEQALSLYSGDFLAQDIYLEWVQQKRLELRTQYINLLMQLGQLYDSRGAVKKAIACFTQVVEKEVLLEKAYQQLILLHTTRGQKNQALQVYERLCEVLARELQSRPEPLTESLYRKLLT